MSAAATRMREDLIEVLTGRRRADRVIVNCRVVDVHRRAVRDGGIAIKGERIVKVGDVEHCIGPDTEVVDAGGRYATPGLIETHAHSYHSNLSPTEYARICLARGTTAVPEAFYGHGQIGGLDAVRFFMDELRRTPITILLQVPVLAYLQNLELGLESTPGAVDGDDLFEILDWPECVGLEEPPYIPMLEKDPVVARLVPEALRRGKLVMGHGAGLQGDELVGYASAGVTSDHEAIATEEALARVEAGIVVSMRECSIARNQRELQKAITEHGCDPGLFVFCSDVPDAVTLVRVGHIDESIRIAIDGGIDPLTAIQMATVNAARYYRVDHDLGSLTPGRQADVVLVSDLERFDVQTVFARGRPVVTDGEFVAQLEQPTYPVSLLNTVGLVRHVTADDLRLDAPPGKTHVRVRVIGGHLVSEERQITVPVVDGAVASDVEQDVLKMAMFDRYARWAEPAIGFIQEMGLKRGALGTSYNPFYNNVLVVGTNDEDMAVAANEVARLRGGFVVVDAGEVVASAALPLCGLLSDEPAERAIPAFEKVYAAAAELGCPVEMPFHNLAFTAVVGELPFLKMSDEGLFDVVKREVLPTILE
jgi:adenine deaminase